MPKTFTILLYPVPFSYVVRDAANREAAIDEAMLMHEEQGHCADDVSRITATINTEETVADGGSVYGEQELEG